MLSWASDWRAARVRAGAQRAAAEEEGRTAHAEAERLRRQLAEAANTSDLDRQFKEVRHPLALVPWCGKKACLPIGGSTSSAVLVKSVLSYGQSLCSR